MPANSPEQTIAWPPGATRCFRKSPFADPAATDPVCMTAASSRPCPTSPTFRPSEVTRVPRAGSTTRERDLALSQPRPRFAWFAPYNGILDFAMHGQTVTNSHNLRQLCLLGRNVFLAVRPENQPGGTFRVFRTRACACGNSVGTDPDRRRDSRSQRTVNMMLAEAGPTENPSGELGPRYRLLYSPVGKPPRIPGESWPPASAARCHSGGSSGPDSPIS